MKRMPSAPHVRCPIDPGRMVNFKTTCDPKELGLWSSEHFAVLACRSVLLKKLSLWPVQGGHFTKDKIKMEKRFVFAQNRFVFLIESKFISKLLEKFRRQN